MLIVFKCLVTNGCFSRSTKLVSSVHWNGMSEAASLRISQQRIINKFLNSYFGHKIVESSKNLAKFNSVFLSYTEQYLINAIGHAVKMWHRSLRSMLEFNFRRTEDEAWFGVKKIEV